MSGITGMHCAFIFVDLQYDFTRKGGICYAPRSSVKFVRDTFLPFVRKNSLKAFEIVSDYRQPRRGDKRDCCRPGEWGYESEVPGEVLSGPRWIKSMNSPIWVRDGIGDDKAEPGEPYQNTQMFEEWLRRTVGSPEHPVILSGLTLDACVLCTAQELTFRGYDVRILREGTDTRSGRTEERDRLIGSPPISFWSRPIRFSELRALIEG